MRAILMFHSVDASGSVLSVTGAELTSLVRSIKASGHRILPLRELLDSPRRDDAVALTFDDGMRSVYAEAIPVLDRESVPATLFLTSDFIGEDDPTDAKSGTSVRPTNRWPTQPADSPTMEMMTWSEVESVRDAGWTIEAHTATHPDLRALDDESIRAEFERNDSEIEKRLGRRPEIFAYPYGYVDARVESLAAERYRYAVTTEMRPLSLGEEAAHRLPRLETYYFRDARIHARFGSLAFAGYLKGRAWLRKVRRG